MAYIHGCDKTTILTRMKDEGGEFFVQYQKGYSEGNQSIKLSQLQLAKSGNATMQIWLGKQRLGQTDANKIDLNITDAIKRIAEDSGLTPDDLMDE